MIYADNAATTRLDIDVYSVMKPYIFEKYANISQSYSFSREAKKTYKESREMIANCIGALPEEIYFTSGGTESNNWAIKGATLHCGTSIKTITSQIEHHSVLKSCATIEKLGFPVTYLSVDRKGIVSPEILKQHLSDNTKLVSIMLANNEIGTIQSISNLCEISHRSGALFHTDAVQATGHIPIDVNQLGVDMLSSSAHKFNGPKGIGFLYIRKDTDIESYMDGGEQEFGKRAGTENLVAVVGMAKSLQKRCDNISRTSSKLRRMEQTLLSVLDDAKIDFIRNGSNDKLPGNISLSFKDFEGEMLMHRLDLMDIIVSTGSACDSKNTQISHVIKAIETPMDYAKGTIRISFGDDNDENDAIEVGKALIKIINS